MRRLARRAFFVFFALFLIDVRFALAFFVVRLAVVFTALPFPAAVFFAVLDAAVFALGAVLCESTGAAKEARPKAAAIVRISFLVVKSMVRSERGAFGEEQIEGENQSHS